MSSEAKLTYRSDYRPPSFLVDEVELRFDLDLPTTRVTSKLRFRRVTDDEQAPLILDGERIRLVGLQLDGASVATDRYRLSEQSLLLIDPPEQGELTVVTDVTPAETGMEGLVHLDGVFVTHCEPAGFRRITYFPDRPDVLARFRCTVVADGKKYPTLLSNGDRREAGTLADGRHFVTWDDPYPKASYLFALVAGRFAQLSEHFVTRSGRNVQLVVHASEEDLPLCRHGMETLVRVMRWDEEAYGLEYDLGVFNIAVMRGYPGGAMENKGLNLYSAESFLGSARTSTDETLAWTEQVIAHEYIHNWSGNRVGCRDWFELSLKEGFTIFRQQQYFATRVGWAVSRIDTTVRIRELQFHEDAGGMAHAARPASYQSVNNLYTSTVYEKGAEIIRMLQTLAGEQAFNAAAREFFRRYDGSAATIDSLIETVEDVASLELSQFRKWYDAIGTLLVRAGANYDAGRRCYELTLQQASETPDTALLPLHVPVRVALFDEAGRALPLRGGNGDAAGAEVVLQLREQNESFVFDDVASAPIPSLLRGFSAPARLECDLSTSALLSLASFDTDLVNRWDAAQRLATRALLGNATDESRLAWFEVCAAALHQRDLDPAVASRMLQLPSERQLGAAQPIVDVDGLHRARLALAAETARRLRPALLEKYRELTDAASKDDAYGARRLRNLALWYLMQDADETALALCRAQVEKAERMEDTVAALRPLLDRGGADRDRALAVTWASWRNSPSQVDQWFAIQAASDAPDCVQRVRDLMSHPALSIDNATRLKALFDTFMRNQFAFHHRSGAGYRMIADLTQRLASSNPRLAARFLRSLDGAHRFDEQRRELIRQTLQQVLARPDIAPNLQEIASRSLMRL
jgi:aminopeptidase N